MSLCIPTGFTLFMFIHTLVFVLSRNAIEEDMLHMKMCKDSIKLDRDSVNVMHITFNLCIDKTRLPVLDTSHFLLFCFCCYRNCHFNNKAMLKLSNTKIILLLTGDCRSA